MYITTEIDVDLSEFCTEDLLAELESRGQGVDVALDDIKETLIEIWERKRIGANYDRLLADLIYKTTGRIL